MMPEDSPPPQEASRLPALLGVLAFGGIGGLLWFAFGGGWLSSISALCALAGLALYLRGEMARWRLFAGRRQDRRVRVLVEEGAVLLLDASGAEKLLLDEIESIWIHGERQSWVFYLADARAVEFPIRAVGGGELPNALVSLPGFDLVRASRAARMRGAGSLRIWVRGEGA